MIFLGLFFVFFLMRKQEYSLFQRNLPKRGLEEVSPEDCKQGFALPSVEAACLGIDRKEACFCRKTQKFHNMDFWQCGVAVSLFSLSLILFFFFWLSGALFFFFFWKLSESCLV